ncbi:MAG: ROK family protein [Thermoplasmata archaeon]|nr:ROK family protein [Thermoplasmata archaeon]
MPSPSTRVASPRSSGRAAGDSRDLTLGIDIGASKVIALVVDRSGRVVRHSGRLPHANDGPAGVIDVVTKAARTCLPEGVPRQFQVGVSVAAQVDPATGMVLHAPNLRWRNLPLGKRIAEAVGGRVSVFNDARSATYAEWSWGAGVGARDLFCLILGTGVGGSAVLGGQLLEGGTHAAGEVGHIPIVSGGRACHCPSAGCFEAYVGGWAIAERGQEAVRGDSGAGRAIVARAGSVERITAHHVFLAARAGDPLAERLVSETERFLGDGAVGVVNSFNPSLLILGGGLVSGRPEWVGVVERAVRKRCQPPSAGVRVVAARLGDDAPAIGAAGLAVRNRAARGR